MKILIPLVFVSFVSLSANALENPCTYGVIDELAISKAAGDVPYIISYWGDDYDRDATYEANEIRGTKAYVKQMAKEHGVTFDKNSTNRLTVKYKDRLTVGSALNPLTWMDIAEGRKQKLQISVISQDGDKVFSMKSKRTEYSFEGTITGWSHDLDDYTVTKGNCQN